MKSLMLCHDCFHWIIPCQNWCTECGSRFDISESDPEEGFINSVIGDIEKEVGSVLIDRSKYPRRGLFYTTTNGILFNPISQYAEKPPFLIKKQSQKINRFSLNFFNDSHSYQSSSESEFSSVAEESVTTSSFGSFSGKSPAEYLLSHPGVFFVSYEAIHSIEKHFYRWKINRTYGKTLIVKPVIGRSQFHFDMQEIRNRIRYKTILNQF